MAGGYSRGRRAKRKDRESGGKASRRPVSWQWHRGGKEGDGRLESPGGSIPQDPVVSRAIWLFL